MAEIYSPPRPLEFVTGRGVRKVTGDEVAVKEFTPMDQANLNSLGQDLFDFPPKIAHVISECFLKPCCISIWPLCMNFDCNRIVSFRAV
ncbi:MAG TPA: hypothetical protein DDY91_15115 [Planctomycetaceae bacterium]|nr:hypothetical protein [Planctomycetaceae bacterium]